MEAKGCPTRRPTTRPLRRTLAAATLLAVTLTACSGTLDTKQVEASVAGQFHDDRIEEQWVAIGFTIEYSATCPVEILDTPGYRFQCSIIGYGPRAGTGLLATFKSRVGEATALVEVLDGGQVYVLDN